MFNIIVTVAQPNGCVRHKLSPLQVCCEGLTRHKHVFNRKTLTIKSKVVLQNLQSP